MAQCTVDMTEPVAAPGTNNRVRQLGLRVEWLWMQSRARGPTVVKQQKLSIMEVAGMKVPLSLHKC